MLSGDLWHVSFSLSLPCCTGLFDKLISVLRSTVTCSQVRVLTHILTITPQKKSKVSYTDFLLITHCQILGAVIRQSPKNPWRKQSVPRCHTSLWLMWAETVCDQGCGGKVWELLITLLFLHRSLQSSRGGAQIKCGQSWQWASSTDCNWFSTLDCWWMTEAAYRGDSLASPRYKKLSTFFRQQC